MSTYYYLQCLDHTPPLLAQDESGQHIDDLDMIINDVKNRNYLTELYVHGRLDGYFTLNTARFLVSHKTCRIGIVDEYGKRHYVDEGDIINVEIDADAYGYFERD